MIEIPMWLFVLFIVLSVLALPTLFLLILYVVFKIHLIFTTKDQIENQEEYMKSRESKEIEKHTEKVERKKKNATTKR